MRLVKDDEEDTAALLHAAQRAKDANPTNYLDALGRHFGHVTDINACYDLVLQLPFKAIVTLNLDPHLAYRARWLQKAGVKTCKIMPYPALERAEMRPGAIYHAHGLIEDGTTPIDGSIVLAASEYDVAYGEDAPLRRFMLDVFQRDALCFIGTRLRDPPFERLFEQARKWQRESKRLLGLTSAKQIALVPDPRLDPSAVKLAMSAKDLALRWEAEREFYLKRDITPEFYDPIDVDHTGLRRELERVADLMPPPIRKEPYGNT